MTTGVSTTGSVDTSTVARGGLAEDPDPSIPVETIIMTAKITATTRIRPKIICHLVLAVALSYAAVPLTVLGVVPGVLELWLTLLVPQFGQRLERLENVAPQRRHFT